MDIELEKMTTANIALDIFSIILSLIPMAYLLNEKRYKEQINLYFLGVAVSNIFMIIGDVADWIFWHPTEQWQKNLLSAGSALFYVASAFVLYFFARYITEYLKLDGNAKKVCLYSVTAVCTVQIVFGLLSPFSGSFFYVTDEGYQRGPLWMISQFVPFFCYLLFTTLIIFYRKRLKRREIVFFLLYIFVPLGGGAMQMLARGIAVVNIGVALELLFILVNIQFEHEITLADQEKELAKKEKMLEKQQTQLLLSQIQSHFLYNSLGTIGELCHLDPQAPEKATEEFANFLRGNMDSLNACGPVPFEKELDHVKNYLNLECRRFQNRLVVRYDIQTTDFYIPPLSIQPLAENAVRHGLCQRKEGGHLTISTKEAGECAVVTIADDGIGIEKSKEYPNLGKHSNIGIANVRSRLEEMVGGSLEIESSNKGTIITIRIPCRKG